MNFKPQSHPRSRKNERGSTLVLAIFCFLLFLRLAHTASLWLFGESKRRVSVHHGLQAQTMADSATQAAYAMLLDPTNPMAQQLALGGAPVTRQWTIDGHPVTVTIEAVE